MPLRRLLASSLLLLPSACGGQPPPPVLWEGFSYEWAHLSHRVSRLRSGVAPGTDEGTIQGEIGLVGGPWSTGEILADQPAWGLRWRAVDAGLVRALYGSEEMVIDAGGRATAEVEVPLEETGWRSGTTLAVALAGIDLDMDVPLAQGSPDYDPTYGWTPQGFGAGLDEPELRDGLLAFDAWMHFKAGPLSCAAGGDCEEMDEAIPFARVGGRLRWVVLAVGPGAGATVTRGRLAAGRYYDAGDGNTPHPPIDEAERTLALGGEAGLAFAVPLLRAWDFELNRGIGEEGRYLRAFSAGIESFEYEAETGRGTVLVDAFCSIESAFEEGDLEVEFEADVDLLQWDEAGATSEAGMATGTEETGGVYDRVLER